MEIAEGMVDLTRNDKRTTVPFPEYCGPFFSVSERRECVV